MKPEDLNLPAIVHHHVDLEALFALGVEQAESVRKTGRVDIEARMALARTLAQIRHNTDDGKWGGYLERIQVTKQRACELITASKLNGEQIEVCESWQEVLELTKTSLESRNRPDPDDSDTASGNKKSEKKKKEVLRCKRCERLHFTGNDCEECKRLRREAKYANRPQGEPGEDWSEDEQEEDQEETQTTKTKPEKQFNPHRLAMHWRKWENELGGIIREVNNALLDRGIKNTPTVEGFKRKFEEALTDIKKVIKQATGKEPE